MAEPWRLALVCCGPSLEVAVGRGVEIVGLVCLGGGSRRSRLLLGAADLLCRDAGIEPDELAEVVVSRGPGSFTGIRSGLATAEGLATATGARVVAVSSLRMQAARVTAIQEVIAAQPGRRGEAYVQRFGFDEGWPIARSAIECMALDRLASSDIARSAADGMKVESLTGRLSAAQALLRLAEVSTESVEPLYVEPPPLG